MLLHLSASKPLWHQRFGASPLPRWAAEEGAMGSDESPASNYSCVAVEGSVERLSEKK